MFSLQSRAWIHVKNLYLRITFTRCTLAFFVASFAFCFAQGFIQAFLHTVESHDAQLVAGILQTANISAQNQFAYLQRPGGAYNLELCTRLPNGDDPGNCTVVFDSSWPATDGVAGGALTLPASDGNAGVTLMPNQNASGVTDGVWYTLSGSGQTTLLNRQCAEVLIYPDQVYKNATREALALVALQFWLFFTAVWAIAYESVPHILAVLITRAVATGWSAYCLWRTQDIQQRWTNLLVAPNTPCHQDLFPGYVSSRYGLQIPDLVFNVLALVTFSILSWSLIRVYREHTLARIGTTPEIQRIYLYSMVVLACLQLGVYWFMTAMGIWIDQVVNDALSHIATHNVVYKFQSITTVVTFLPWIVLGWWALTRENKIGLAVFLGWAVALIVAWAIDFYSLAFRFTFVQWPFFGCLITWSFVVLVLTVVFTLICYFHFGRGFAHYLHVDRMLAKSDFEPEVFERARDDIEKAPLPFEPLTTRERPDTFLPSLAGGPGDEKSGRDGASTVSAHAPLPTYLQPFGQ